MGNRCKVEQRQVVGLPEGSLTGKEVFVEKAGNGVLLPPLENRWQLMWDSLDELEGDIFADGRNQPTEAERRESFDQLIYKHNLSADSAREFGRVLGLRLKDWTNA